MAIEVVSGDNVINYSFIIHYSLFIIHYEIYYLTY
jgi:hypothetical protein